MRRLFSAWLLCILAFGLVLTGAYSVSAQEVLDKRLSKPCVEELKAIGKPLENQGKYLNVFDINANLPFTPKECAKDSIPDENPTGIDKRYLTSGTSAIPVKYFPFILLRVYKFMVSLAFYLFGLGLIVLGITIQTGVFTNNYSYYTKIKTYFGSAITGLVTVLFAYYIVAIILWIFNVDDILSQEIIKEVPKP
jgi:hypothetical protein